MLKFAAQKIKDFKGYSDEKRNTSRKLQISCVQGYV